jgi:peptidoglycan L-alanyl-D-glutamate endopeptidase CwlK
MDQMRTGINPLYQRLGITPEQLARADISSEADATVIELRVGDRSADVGTLQQTLLDKGFDPQGVDEIFGSNTLDALQQFQQSRIDALDQTLAEGPPPLARNRLLTIRNELQDELGRDVAGAQTFTQLGIESAETQAPAEPDVAPPVPPAGPTQPTDTPDTIGAGSSEADVRRVQHGLDVAGYDVDVDGAFGPQSAAALQAYQTEQIDQLDQSLRAPLPPRERAIFEGQRNSLIEEREAGVAGVQTQATLRADVLRVEGPIDWSEIDPRGVLQDEKMNPVFRDKLRATLVDLVEQGFSPEIFEGTRSFARQEELYAQGRRGIPGESTVTGAEGGESWHQYGLAADIVHQGSNKWRESDLWDALGEAGERQGLYWGGNFGDRPHLEFHPGYTPGQAGRLDSIFDDGQASLEELQAIWNDMGL